MQKLHGARRGRKVVRRGICGVAKGRKGGVRAGAGDVIIKRESETRRRRLERGEREDINKRLKKERRRKRMGTRRVRIRNRGGWSRDAGSGGGGELKRGGETKGESGEKRE